MDISALIAPSDALRSPSTFAALVGVAVGFAWLAFAPARPVRTIRKRLDGYVERVDLVDETEVRRSLLARLILPGVRRILRLLGRLTPWRSMEATRRMLVQAGQPGGLSVLDFYGLRLLATVGLGGGWLWAMAERVPVTNLLLGALIAGGVGFFLPALWLRGRVSRRKREIVRALPNALDMMTVGVEAGLAFESAMLRVTERWHNALTEEYRRTVAEMRVGTPRDEALRRMAERTDVPDLNTFVAVLVQSSQLGVSIANVLHIQAAQIREKRRLRAEELAQQASIKMLFPLVFMIFPAMFVVILGPAVPSILSTLGRVVGGG